MGKDKFFKWDIESDDEWVYFYVYFFVFRFCILVIGVIVLLMFIGLGYI